MKALFLILFLFLANTLAWSQTDYKNTETGTASYYSKKFHGRKTASGERFHKDSITAAHHKLPFGTIIKVTNLKTGDTLYARVNDRIGHRKRILDLSPEGAKRLNYLKTGTTKVKIDVIRLP